MRPSQKNCEDYLNKIGIKYDHITNTWRILDLIMLYTDEQFVVYDEAGRTVGHNKYSDFKYFIREILVNTCERSNIKNIHGVSTINLVKGLNDLDNYAFLDRKVLKKTDERIVLYNLKEDCIQIFNKLLEKNPVRLYEILMNFNDDDDRKK